MTNITKLNIFLNYKKHKNTYFDAISLNNQNLNKIIQTNNNSNIEFKKK